MQVLKEEVRKRICDAAEEAFYLSDYRSVKLQNIAKKAGITVGLIYTYFKNKASLFDATVADVYRNFNKAIEAEEDSSGSALDRFESAGKSYVLRLLQQHRKLVILMDHSMGTPHSGAKDELVEKLEAHIRDGLAMRAKKRYDPMLAHILASNFTEGLLEIARHYKGPKWAADMLEVLMKVYYQGVESL